MCLKNMEPLDMKTLRTFLARCCSLLSYKLQILAFHIAPDCQSALDLDELDEWISTAESSSLEARL